MMPPTRSLVTDIETIPGRSLPPDPAVLGLDEDATAPGSERVLAQVRAGGSHGDDDEGPRRMGRFVLLERLGTGAMGVVYAAYDDILDRKIAIKVLRSDVATGTRARNRMMSEAQALAKLRHPNVVQIYGAGVHEQTLFIAMELVAGTTLSTWRDRDEGVRPWSEVLRVYRQAGQGLAAAHEAGVVHRDFKPDNAMLGDDGVVRVMDFGLARLDQQVTEQSLGEGIEELRDTTAREPALLPGVGRSALAGTPAYMAPEQWGSRAVDARADQFSFCVALYEALWGHRPFEADSIASLGAAVIEGRLSKAPPPPGLPDRILRAILRGLSTKPQDRWPTMSALLEALAEPRGRGRWMLSLAGAAVLVGVVVSAGGSPSTEPCAGVATSVSELWNPERREELREVMAAVEVGFAADTADRVGVVLEDYAEQLRHGRREACEATMVERTQSEAVMLQRMRCLDRRQRDLRIQLEVLARPDAELMARAVDSVLSLPPSGACSDLAYLSSEVEPPDDPETAAGVEEIRDMLSRIDALQTAQKYTRSLPMVEQAVARARTYEYRPILVAALNRLATVQRTLGDLPAALASVREAYLLSDDAWGLESARTHQQLCLVYHKLARSDDATVECRRALVLRERVLGRPDLETAQLHTFMGVIFLEQGRIDQSIEELEAARSIVDGLSVDVPLSTSIDNNLAFALEAKGQLEQARAMTRRVLERRIEMLGASHPLVGIAHNNLAGSLRKLGRLEEALVEHQMAIDILQSVHDYPTPALAKLHQNSARTLSELGRNEEALEQLRRLDSSSSFGAEPVLLADTYGLRGLVLRRMGRLDDARVEYEKGLAVVQETLEGDHQAVARLRFGLGVTFMGLGAMEEARRELEHAKSTFSDELGPEDMVVANTRNRLGHVLVELGRAQRALVELEAAAAVYSGTEGMESNLFGSLRWMARARLKLGHADDAAALAQRCVRLGQRLGEDPADVAAVYFLLARALLLRGAETSRVSDAAARSAEILGGLGEEGASQLAEVEAWRAEHLVPETDGPERGG